MKTLILTIIALACAGCAVLGAESLPPPAGEPSGAYYDWTRTKQPERPFFHKYDQSLVMKIFLAEKTNGGQDCKVFLTFEQALEVICKLDNLTCGVPKIVYLVGWQYNGHDSKYPAWGEVNARLKRPQDKTALDSLKWLIAEGRKHHTTVSLHINMFDAFESSPLWTEYLAKDIIAKGKDGKPLKGEVFDGGEQSYQLSYAKEWETGCAKRRIDGLLAMLPELKEGHTLHIDAFHNYPPVPHAYPKGKYPDRDWDFKGISPFLGYGPEKECAAMRKTFRYFRDQGIDITSEGSTFLRQDAFVGLQPMAWSYNAPAGGIPPSLYCGTPMKAEPEIKRDPAKLNGLLEQFCLNAAPFVWANAWRAADDRNQPQAADWNRIRQGNDCCVTLVWKPGKTLIAYSRTGYAAKTWDLPADWITVKTATLSKVGIEPPVPAGTTEIKDGKLTLSLKPGEAILIEAK
jgi:hypothetical protein